MKGKKRVYKVIYKIDGHRVALNYHKLFSLALRYNTDPFETVTQYIYNKYPKLFPLFNLRMFDAIAKGYEVFEDDMFDLAKEAYLY